MVLSAYARALRCPVRSERMAYALATRCPVLMWRIMLQEASWWRIKSKETLRKNGEHVRWRRRVEGLGSRVQGSGFRVQGLGSRVQGPGSRVQGSGSRV
eukprot:2822504-Rhodomonas_salina.1